MAGGILQLVAKGIQDLYLTEDPQITFFKGTYRRHTFFSIESISQYFTSNLKFGGVSTCIITKKGDMIGNTILVIDLPEIPIDFENPHRKVAWAKYLGHVMVEEYTLRIGETVIDKRYGEWLHIWSEINDVDLNGLYRMIGNVPEIYKLTKSKDKLQLYIPLTLYFNKSHGLALPIVALNTEVSISVKIRKLSEDNANFFSEGDVIYQVVDGVKNLAVVHSYDYLTNRLYYQNTRENAPVYKSSSDVKSFFNPVPVSNSSTLPVNKTVSDSYKIYRLSDGSVAIPAERSIGKRMFVGNQALTPNIQSAYINVDYIFLGNAKERTKFMTSPLEYLIEQVQKIPDTIATSTGGRMKVSLFHPCQEICWLGSLISSDINKLFDYELEPGVPVISKSSLKADGIERLSERSESHYRLIQSYQHYENTPPLGVNLYSFSLYPTKPLPSGTMNMSKINLIETDNKFSRGTTVNVNSNNPVKLRGYAVNVNILRMFGGEISLGFIGV
jgi:hypothetical protein